MLIAIIMLASFVVQLTIFLLLDLTETLGAPSSARIIVYVTALFGLIYQALTNKKNWQHKRDEIIRKNVRAKYFGLASLLTLMLLYSTFISQLSTALYADFSVDFYLAFPFIIFFLPFYLKWAEHRLLRTEDGLLLFGQALTRQRRWIFKEQKIFLLSWAVKIIFIPAMYGSLIVVISDFLEFKFVTTQPIVLISWVFMFGLSFDLLIASFGYIFSSQLIGTEVLSTDQTWLGWLVCVICYPPLMSIFRIIREQTDNVLCHHWLEPTQPLYWIWAILISLSWIIYWLSTASFGLRFSNLSWRGLISHGPYRYSKHPSYIAKNIYWWLYTVPFIGVDNNIDLIRNLLALSFVSLVYYLRAKTEERHLMHFPEYVAYSEWIAQHGLIAQLSKTWHRKRIY